MQNDILATLAGLSDTALVMQIKTLIGRERDVTAEVVAHLAELDTRDVHLREGYPSLFVYCRDVLGLSEWEAYNRIEVARTVRRFPMILGMLADGSVHLTAVRRLAPHLTIQNHKEVLDSARGKTKAEVLEIIARLSPRPDVAASVRRLPETAGVLTKPVLAEVSDGAPREVAAVCGTVAAAAGPAESCNPAPFKAEPHTPGPGQPSRGTVRPLWSRCRRAVTSFNSRSAGRRSRSCASRRTCSGMRIRLATKPRCWTGP